jgi:hypothetical protein
MLRIFYHPNGLQGVLHKDGDVEASALKYWELTEKFGMQNWMTCQELVILALRALIKEGRIPHDKVEFNFVKEMDGHKIKDVETIYPTRDGRFASMPPAGFCDIPERLLTRLIEPNTTMALVGPIQTANAS